MAEKRYGLVLDLGGAPNTPHLVPGLPGFYRPDIPTPVGADGDVMDLGRAREAAGSNLPVRLKEMGPTEAKRAEELTKETIEEQRHHRTAVPPDPVLAEAARESKE